MTAPVVLALDLATTTGWAVGPADGRPTFGSWTLGVKGTRAGAKGVRFTRCLVGMLAAEMPDVLAIEEPMRVGVMAEIGSTAETVMMLYGLAFQALTIAEARGLGDVRRVGVQDVRGHFVGQRRFKAEFDPIRKKKISSSQRAKEATKAQCRRLGYAVEDDDNQADAIATWHFVAARVHPPTALRATGLFGEARPC